MNIVLIVIDTLRADHLSCYGYFRETSPTLDRIAKEGVLFENYYASGIATGPGFTSIITGRYPTTHKYYLTPYNVTNVLSFDDNIPVLAEIMWVNGYTTVAIDNLINFKSRPKHFLRGYEYYINPSKSPFVPAASLMAEQANKKIIPWIKAHSYERFFMFIHYWDPHLPYNQPRAYRELYRHEKGKFGDLKILESPDGYKYVPGWGKLDEIVEESDGRTIDLYDGEIAYVDNAIAEVVETLKDEGILDDTLLIITSDHGEGLGQHGIWGHAGLHENIIKLPLILRYPKKFPKGIRVKSYVQHADIVPTILELAGIDNQYVFDGSSLRKSINSNIRDFAVSEAWGERAIIFNEWKLIIHYERELRVLKEIYPKPFTRQNYRALIPILRKTFIKGNKGYELYNIVNDPMEIHNLAEEYPSKVKELEEMIEKWIVSKVGDNDPINYLGNYVQPQPV